MPDRRSGNLPADVTSFVGRRHELTELRRLVSEARLVTLTGVGGVGKTRLALRVAAEVQRAFPDGVWLVDLAGLQDPVLLAQTIAAALRIVDQQSRWSVSMLSEHLADRELLLVLDNCEHLVDACAILADTLLRTCPGLTIVATSREALRGTAEAIYPVPPLSLPNAARTVPPVTALAGYEAVTLFAERARAANRHFALTEENRSEVVALCRRLDGLPLALELAAVRLRTLSVEQLADRLDDRFRLLTTGRRGALARQQTLHALIDWSFDLCSLPERRLWARAAVFAGGFDLEAAEAVCSGDPLDREEVLDVLAGLVDKSVLLTEERTHTLRYRMLETIRDYGREKLTESGETTALRARHLDYFAGVAARAERHLFTADQLDWLDRLRTEHANLRVALEFCAAEPGRAPAGLAMSAALWQYWQDAGLLGEGRRWLDRLLALAPDPTPARTHALYVAAWLALLQHDLAAAAPALRECDALARQFGDDAALGYVELFTATLDMADGDLDSAARHHAEALAQLRRAGEVVGQAMTLYRAALLAFCRHDGAEVRALAGQAESLCTEHGDRWWRAYALWVLGLQSWEDGDERRAIALQRESLTLNDLFGDRLGIALSLEALGWIAAAADRHTDAALLLGAARNLWHTLGSPLSEFHYLVGYREACQTAARTALGEKRYQATVQRGTTLDIEQAVRCGLGEPLEPGRAQTRVPTAASAAADSPLTRREVEVAELVAQGMSNKDIASVLVLSQRTAETHVANILTKLGFTSRAQVAAWVAEHRGAPRGS